MSLMVTGTKRCKKVRYIDAIGKLIVESIKTSYDAESPNEAYFILVQEILELAYYNYSRLALGLNIDEKDEELIEEAFLNLAGLRHKYEGRELM